MAVKRLTNELKKLSEYSEFSCFPTDNFFVWDIIIFGPNDTLYEGGIFKCEMNFTPQYPQRAPKLRFKSKITHPNIYKDGNVCISILHEGKDEYGYESISERWNPSHGVSSVLLSVISMLGDPNFESPANIDASVLYKNNLEEYKSVVYSEVSETQK